MGLVGNKAKDPIAVGCVGERAGRPLGSVFLNIFPRTRVAAIGPLTVAPECEGAGRFLMQATLEEARKRGIE